MNEPPVPTNPTPPQISGPPFYPAALVPLGSVPEDRQPVSGPVAAIESILREPRRVLYHLRQPGSGRLVLAMLFISIVCAAIYGVVVGTFSMETQLWAAPVKIAAGLLVSALICLPSLYIFACLSGSQARLREIVGLVAGLLLLSTILLIGFAPVAWLFSQSTQSAAWMGTLHLAFWFIAALFGIRFLRSGFSHSNARSAAGLYTWVIIFMLVTLQMTTALRPLVGTSDTFLPEQKKFFLVHWGDCLSRRP